jgi:hypothetical protein
VRIQGNRRKGEEMKPDLIDEIASKYRQELAKNFMDDFTALDLGVINRALTEYAQRADTPEAEPSGVTVPREPTDAQEAAGGIVLWEKQFEGTPWKNKVKLIDPASMGEYNEVARHVYEAMLAAAESK